MSLTEHLTSLTNSSTYKDAINHPFLTAAGNGTLPHDLLAFWLSQDRTYAAHAYSRFIGLLISKIPFKGSDGLASEAEKRNQKLLKVLVGTLENIVREEAFFVEASVKWGLPIEGWKERKGTRDHTAEMIYLDSWTRVKDLVETSDGLNSAQSNPTISATQAFVGNWSSEEFVKFVDEIAVVTDERGAVPGTDAWMDAERVFERVVELEHGFWPLEGEEKLNRIKD